LLRLDNSRFGQQYLEKFGWTAGSGSGLGASGQGRLSHISVGQKLNLLGIGGGNNHNNDGDVSWKQNREYELMLKRLNTSTTTGGDDDDNKEEGEDESIRVIGGFVRAGAGESKVMDEKVATDVSIKEEGEEDEEERKRLRKERKRRRKEEAVAKAKAKASSSSSTTDAVYTTVPSPQPVSPSSTKPSRRLAYVACYYPLELGDELTSCFFYFLFY
jgi:Pin2-interacting protein X1